MAAKRFELGDPASSGYKLWLEYCEGRPPWNGEAVIDLGRSAEVVSGDPTSDAARASLQDFVLFREVFLGHLSLAWHEDMAHHIMRMFRQARETGERLFLLLNGPPGPGKSTALRDTGMWATAQDRSLRGCNVSMSESLAIKTTALMKREFERVSPAQAKERDVRLKFAKDATLTLAQGFGQFKPDSRSEIWTREAFTVLQAAGRATSEKEPTWSSFGLDSAILGNRFDLMLCDDMVDNKRVRTDEARERTQSVYGDEVETRLDAGGLLVLAGQRLHPQDIYAWARDLEIEPDFFDDGDEVDLSKPTPKYFHLKYAAHDDSRCRAGEDRAVHRRDAPAWPEGCLLDPYRVPWAGLAKMRTDNPFRFFTIYQQEDYFDDDALLPQEWLEQAWDVDRAVWGRPKGLINPLCVVTVDPSSARFWAVQSWVYQDAGAEERTGRRYLLDAKNQRMEAGELLDRNFDTLEFYGVLEDCRVSYEKIGLRLSHVVVEVNAAQRYLLQFEHAKRWQEIHGIEIRPHTTGIRKLDEAMGVKGLCKSQWKFGRVRLPGADIESRHVVDPLVKQAMRWPIEPNDQVMAHWFLEVNLPTIYEPPVAAAVAQHRPSWTRAA